MKKCVTTLCLRILTQKRLECQAERKCGFAKNTIRSIDFSFFDFSGRLQA